MPQPVNCPLCHLARSEQAEERARAAELNQALVELPYRTVAERFDLSEALTYRHIQHTAGLQEARRAHSSANRKQERAPAQKEFVEAVLEGEAAGEVAPAAPVRNAGLGRVRAQKQSVSPVARKVIARAENLARAAQLRLEGHSWPMVAQEIGLFLSDGTPDAKAAWRFCHEYVRDKLRFAEETTEELRTLEAMRLDGLHRALYAQATKARVVIDGETYSVDAEAQHRAALLVVQISKERRKLLGLDKPRPRDDAYLYGSGGVGPNALPPPLQHLDPPPSVDELEVYAATGIVPIRGQPAPPLLHAAPEPAPPPPTPSVVPAPPPPPPAPAPPPPPRAAAGAGGVVIPWSKPGGG